MWNPREFLQYNKGELIRSDRRGADGLCQKAVLECKTSQDGIGQEHYALASGVHFCTLKPEFIYSLEKKNRLNDTDAAMAPPLTHANHDFVAWV